MVTVKLKWGEEYRGILESKDDYAKDFIKILK